MNAADFATSSIPEPNSGCFLWERCCNPAGYGVVNWRGKAQLAHRVAYEIAVGAPPSDGRAVCHRCDNPSCVNPEHLFLGTQLDNVRDMDAKARRRNAPLSGERHPNSKLTTSQVIEIKAHRGSATPIARRLGVTPEQINNIRRGAQRKEA